MASIKRIGVLTGGGDCPGLNAVIRAVTKAAMNEHKLEVYGVQDGFLGLIQNRMHPLQWNDVSNILTQGGTILGTSNQANPQRFAIERGGRTEWCDVTDRVLDHVRANDLDALVCIGGDGTMTGAANQNLTRWCMTRIPKGCPSSPMYLTIHASLSARRTLSASHRMS